MERKLKLIVPENFKGFGEKVNTHICHIMGTDENYITNMQLIRFGNGEGKCVLNESIRDQDVFILTDVGNYDICYKTRNKDHYMMPDEHYQDIKRILSAMNGHGRNITLFMPYLYQSRQDKRSESESLDCAMALQEMEKYGIKEIVTFDAHNPVVANAIPNKMTFSNGYATGELILSILENEEVNREGLFVVAPDEGARAKAKFLADILGGVQYGNFDKRRNYNVLDDGGFHPITYHEFVGPERLDGRDIIVIDDMIASGNSLIDTARQLKARGANHIYLMTTFALFTDGIEMFNKAYKEGIFDRIYSTNLSYVPEEYKKLDWYKDVDCSYKAAQIITNLVDSNSIRALLNGKEETALKIKSLTK